MNANEGVWVVSGEYGATRYSGSGSSWGKICRDSMTHAQHRERYNSEYPMEHK